MEDIIVIIIVVVIVAFAGLYIYKAKKSGKKCVGCPGGCNCSKNVYIENNESSCDCAGCPSKNMCHKESNKS